MWKFKTSKYKNAVPKIPKKEEWITDISANNLMHSSGNHISASSAYIVFNTDASAPGNLGVVPLDTKGRHHSSSLNHISAHAEYVTDFDFSPFDDYLLATCSQDHSVRIWHLPETIESDVNSPEYTLRAGDRRIENVLWHPLVTSILGLTYGNTFKVYDISTQQCKYEYAGHGDQIQNFTWKADGSLVATSCKDLQLRIIDPRTQSIVQEAKGHQNIKESRVIWMGNKDIVLSTGYDRAQQRQVMLHDTRQLSNCLATQSWSSSMGSLMPLFDQDTNMLFLPGKGDTSVGYFELTDKAPYLTQDSADTLDQVKGVCMLPKRALDVMNGEVNRLLVLSKNAIVPVPYIVPRKSYTEFHEDLFPITASGEPSMTVDDWCQGNNTQCNKASLDPSKKQIQKLLRKNIQELDILKNPGRTVDNSCSVPKVQQNEASQNSALKNITASDTQINNQQTISSVQNDQSPKPEKPVVKAEVCEPKPEPVINPAILREKKQHKVFSGVRQSKFRHLEGSTENKSQNIENIRNLSKTIPGESDMFQANAKYCAVPLGGAGGCISVIKTTESGRLPETGIPVVQNGSNIMDFVFDPFNDSRLVVACDDAKIRVWDIPEGGLTETLTEPSTVLSGHTEKIYFVRFHPMAKDVLASGSYDMSIRIWDLGSGKEVLRLEGHTDTIFCFDWSLDGRYFITACKDGELRVYDPRNSTSPIKTGVGPEGTRGARVKWVLNDKFIAVSGFDKFAKRILYIYSSDDLKAPLNMMDFDVAPAILVPHYDTDTSTLFLTGRGDGIVRAVEVTEEYPHLYMLSDYKTAGLHQGLSFLSKQHINVKNVEFARALRLTPNSIEPVSFTVPRIKTQFFQDDVFPDTRITWQPVLSSSEWFSGENKTQKTISLQPIDMKKLSEAPVEAPKARKYESFQEYKTHYKTDEEKKEELLAAMNTKLDIQNDPLPQDLAEGVDDDEWDD